MIGNSNQFDRHYWTPVYQGQNVFKNVISVHEGRGVEKIFLFQRHLKFQTYTRVTRHPFSQ